jgi:hypothetical protein
VVKSDSNISILSSKKSMFFLIVAQNYGDFMVITSIGSENIMTYTIVNISYYTP